MLFEIPLNIRRGDDAISFLKDLSPSETYIFHGHAISRALKNELGLEDFPSVEVVDNVDFIETITHDLAFSRAIHILAIGGGSVVDIAKRSALLYNKELIAMPTVIANDGLISPIAVLNQKGKKVSLPGKMPSDLLLNYKILESAPERYVNASLLDSLSNRSATYDWRYFSKTFKPSNELSAILAEVSARHVLGANDYSPLEKVRVAIDQQVMSGISMLLAGSSQPCSGSEHILCRIADVYAEFDGYLHGELVGALSLFSMYLQKEIAPQDIEFVSSIFPQWRQIFKIITEMIGAEDFFKDCHNVRPERQTILNQFTETELAAELRSFIKYAN